MPDYAVHFPSSRDTGTGRYKLMELPKELLAVFQEGATSSRSSDHITIRGREDDDAVLCTVDKTYSIKAITVSNAFCVLTPPRNGESGELILQDTVKEIIEVVPTVPKLSRLDGLLRGQIYDEGAEEEEGRSKPRMTLSDIKRQVQASDHELYRALKDKRILNLKGVLRPISQSYLNSVLELLLNTLVALNLNVESVPVLDVVETLQSDHDVSSDVCIQVMSWLGDLSDGIEAISARTTWKMDVDAVVRQLGLGVLIHHRENPISEDDFLQKWRQAAGDTFEGRVDLALLQGNYIAFDSSTNGPVFKYFPSAELPTSPPERFSDLFLTQPQWEAKAIAPFLTDITVDNKDRDKLLMKHSRSTVDKSGNTWYSAKGATVF